MEYQSWGLVLFLFALAGIIGWWCYRYVATIHEEIRRTEGLSADVLRRTGGYDILARYGSLDANEDLLLLQRGKRSGPFVQVRAVRCGWSMLWLTLHDGRVIGAPLARYPQLAVANWRQRQRWELRGDGSVVAWPDLELQVSARVLLGYEQA